MTALRLQTVTVGVSGSNSAERPGHAARRRTRSLEPEPPPTRGAVILIGQAAAPLRDGLRFMLAPLWCDLGCCSRTVVVNKAAVNPRLSSSPSRALLVKTKLLARGAYDRQDRLRSRPVALCL